MGRIIKKDRVMIGVIWYMTISDISFKKENRRKEEKTLDLRI